MQWFTPGTTQVGRLALLQFRVALEAGWGERCTLPCLYAACRCSGAATVQLSCVPQLAPRRGCLAKPKDQACLLLGQATRRGLPASPRLPASPAVLHYAMASCMEEETALLIADSGMDVSISVSQPVQLGGDSGGDNTMLHLAAMRGWARMAERLVAAGGREGRGGPGAACFQGAEA